MASPRYRDRVIDFRRVPAGELLPDDRNWRTHPAEQRRAMEQMLDRLGNIDVLKVRQTPAGLMLVDGHLRADIRADEIVPVIVLDLDESEAGEALITYDPLAGLADADVGKLRRLIDAHPELPDMGLLQSNLPGKTYFGEGLFDNWSNEKMRGTMADTVGFRLGSVWTKPDDDEELVFKQYALRLPTDRNGRQYSRSPLLEIQRIVRTYMRPGDRFVELCAGWWTFSTTAILHGYSGTGVDLWGESIKFLRRQLRRLPHDVRQRLTAVHGDATATGLPDGGFDYCFCNVPFLDVELYSGDAREIASDSVADWAENVRRLFVEIRRLLRPGGLVSFVIADKRRDGTLMHLTPVVERAVDQVGGFALHDLVVQHMRSGGIKVWRHAYDRRRVVKEHEYVMTWRKADAKAPAADPAP